MSHGNVVIKIDRRGCGSVMVNGMELSHMVRATFVSTQAGLPTKVEIQFYPELVTVEAEAVLKTSPVSPDALLTAQADGFVTFRERKGRK